MKDLKLTMQENMHQEYVKAEDIPDIELYVDQIITLMDARLGKNKRNADEKVITKTMINNYSKDGILKRIKGKKYSKQHVMMILLVCGMKRGMAVQDIARIMTGLNEYLSTEQGGYEPSLVGELYERWGKTGDLVEESLGAYVGGLVDSLSASSGKDDPLPAIMILTEIAAQCSRTAEALIDESFPEKKK